MSVELKGLVCRSGLIIFVGLLAACSSAPQQQASGIQENRITARNQVDQQLTNVYTQIEKGDLVVAEQSLREARQKDPANPYVALNLGVIYQRTGRPDLAMAEYATVLNAEAASVKAGHPPLQVYWRTKLTDLVQANIDVLNRRTSEKPRTGLPDPSKKIAGVVTNWRNALIARNPDAYVEQYVATYKGGEASRQAWEMKSRSVFSKGLRGALPTNQFKVEILDQETAKVVFAQKVPGAEPQALVLSAANGQWLICDESGIRYE